MEIVLLSSHTKMDYLCVFQGVRFSHFGGKYLTTVAFNSNLFWAREVY